MSLPPYICNPDGGRGAEAAGCGEKAGNAPTLIRNTDGYIDVSGSGTFLVVIDINEDKVRKIIDLSEVKNPVFVQAGKRENISSGESLPILFGKIKKWFADLKAVAFSGSYSDLSNKPEALKNPQALTFTGGVTGSYDGSKTKSVEIPKVPASLPANGGNADTVDEKHASDLQDYNNLTNKPTIVNNATTTGGNTVLDGRMGKILKDAIDKLDAVTYGNGTRNATYLSADSTCHWAKCGRLCHVDMSIKQVNANTMWPDGALLFSGLPPALNDEQFSYPAMISIQNTFVAQNGLLLINTSGEIREHYYFKPMNGQTSKLGFTYICKN